MAGRTTARSLWDNSRFYVLATSVVISVLCIAWFRVTLPSDQLFYIRTQQVLGLLALVYWYGALAISPVTYVVGKQRLRHVVFMRRAIGVSAAYFALLHFGIALWGQLGGLAGLWVLPGAFQLSLALGAVAMVALGAMALTSFDAVIRAMTFRRWKWLHRIAYGAFIAVLLHIWMIGSHVTYSGVQIAALTALMLLAAAESYRILKELDKKWHIIDGRMSFAIMMSVALAGWFSLMVVLPAALGSYHASHEHEGVQHVR